VTPPPCFRCSRRDVQLIPDPLVDDSGAVRCCIDCGRVRAAFRLVYGQLGPALIPVDNDREDVHRAPS